MHSNRPLSKLSGFGHCKQLVHIDKELATDMKEKLREAPDMVPFICRRRSNWAARSFIESCHVYQVSHICFSFMNFALLMLNVSIFPRMPRMHISVDEQKTRFVFLRKENGGGKKFMSWVGHFTISAARESEKSLIVVAHPLNC